MAVRASSLAAGAIDVAGSVAVAVAGAPAGAEAICDHASGAAKARSAAHLEEVGVANRPMNRMLPVVFSRMKNKNG